MYFKRKAKKAATPKLRDGLHVVRTDSKDPSQAWAWFVIESGLQTVGCREVGYSTAAYARQQARKTLSGGYAYLLDAD